MTRLAARLPKLKSTLFLFITMLTVLITIAITARAWLTPAAGLKSVPATFAASERVAPPQAATIASAQLATERITIHPNGFDPEEITRPAGEVMIAIDNRSGLEEVRLRLDREGGERLVDESVSRRKLDWRKRVNLTPGQYRLTEANHPDWQCLITITP